MSCGCGCASPACGGQSMGFIGGVDAGECDYVFRVFVSGEQIDHFRARLAPMFESTNRAVLACPSLPADERAAWDGFFGAWRALIGKPANWFFAYDEHRATCEYAHSLDAWREKLANYCALSGPTIEPPQAPGAMALTSAVKWGAAAVIAAAIVYGVSKVV